MVRTNAMRLKENLLSKILFLDPSPNVADTPKKPPRPSDLYLQVFMYYIVRKVGISEVLLAHREYRTQYFFVRVIAWNTPMWQKRVECRSSLYEHKKKRILEQKSTYKWAFEDNRKILEKQLSDKKLLGIFSLCYWYICKSVIIIRISLRNVRTEAHIAALIQGSQSDVASASIEPSRLLIGAKTTKIRHNVPAGLNR